MWESADYLEQYISISRSAVNKSAVTLLIDCFSSFKAKKKQNNCYTFFSFQSCMDQKQQVLTLENTFSFWDFWPRVLEGCDELFFFFYFSWTVHLKVTVNVMNVNANWISWSFIVENVMVSQTKLPLKKMFPHWYIKVYMVISTFNGHRRPNEINFLTLFTIDFIKKACSL